MTRERGGIVDALFQQLFVLYVFIFLGWLLGRIKKDAAQKSGLLSFLLVNLFFPCKLFLNYAKRFTVDYVRQNGTVFFIAIGILAVLVLIGEVLARLLTRDGYARKVYSYNTPITNYAYFGYLLVEQVFGPGAMNNLMVFCIPTSLYCYTFGVAKLMDRKVSLKSLRNTITISIGLGIVWGLLQLPLPGAVETAMTSASGCVGPVSMVLVGLVLSTFSPKDLLPDVSTVVFCLVRLLLVPLAVLGMCKGLGAVMTLPEAVYPSAVLMACMPCGLNPVVFPRLIGQDCRLGAKLILLSSILSAATIPLWLWIIG